MSTPLPSSWILLLFYTRYRGEGIWGTSEKVAEVRGKGIFSLLGICQLGTIRVYTRYRGKGNGTGEKVFEVPGIKHFPK